MIKGVLFDMDGVLVDNMAVHAVAFEKFCEQFGVKDIKDRLYKCAGMGNDEIMDIMLPADVVALRGKASLAAEKEAIYREIYAGTIAPIEGLVDLLKEFNAQGIKCAVGSSGCRENVEFVLDKCGLANHFSALVYCDLVTRCKPDPEIYLTAAELIGVDPAECIVFEDAFVGIEAARNAKVAKVIALSTTVNREELVAESVADEVITDFREVLGRAW